MNYKFIEIIKKIGKLDSTLAIISKSTGEEIYHSRISRVLWLGILIFTILDIGILLAYGIQVRKIGRLQQKIIWQDKLIQKIIAQKPEVQPVLNRSRSLETQFFRYRKENKAMVAAWQRVRKKGRYLFPKARRRFFHWRSSNLIALHPISQPGLVITTLDRLENNLKQLEPVLRKESKAQKQLLTGLKIFEHRLDHTPSLYPVQAKISSQFGLRLHPIHQRYIKHDGVDLAAGYESEVQAAADGVVVFADWAKGYGLTVVINHDYGYQTYYGHNSLLLVHPGQTVKKGQVICLSGNSGVSTGPHMHYEIRFHGEPIMPVPFMKEKVRKLKLKSNPFRGSGSEVVLFAKKMLNSQYPKGVVLPTESDCSGFIRYVFGKFGYILPHEAAEQAQIGIPVLKNRLQRGDLVFFTGDDLTGEDITAVNHVGIYIGKNQFIHVSPDFGTVCIDSLKDDYYQTQFKSARRIVYHPDLLKDLTGSNKIKRLK